MRRIVYLCPADDSPIGGIKVIYRHVEALNRSGVKAFVLHPSNIEFRCTWFRHCAPFLTHANLDAASDFVIIPEIWSLEFGPRCHEMGMPYAIFFQNGYLSHELLYENPPLLESVIRFANLILSISSDTDRMIQLNFPTIDPARLVRVGYSIPNCFTQRPDTLDVPNARRVITFMPRKMAAHAWRVAYALRHRLHAEWRLQAIDNVDEATCAAMLRSSCIFLSFSDMEGLPLPPLEAALAGNVVIGYAGHGNADHWQQPNFQAIEQGNIIEFVRTAAAAAARIGAGLLLPSMLQPGITALANRFSAAAEAETLRTVVGRIIATSPTA